MQAKSNQVEAARGEQAPDLVIENVQLVNVFTGEIYPADIEIAGGMIVHIGLPGSEHAPGAQCYPGQGKYAVPGLVDSHIHIESSMMEPAGFAEAVLPRGTTTVVIDPHEIGNVAGKRGVRYMLDATAHLPLRVFVQAPSCVPAVPALETAGAAFDGVDVAEMLTWERTIGLAEVMDFAGVVHQDPRMQRILAAAQEKNTVISGHCPSLSGRLLSAYLVAGPASDHETNNIDEMCEKLRAGMTIEGRVSSFVESMSFTGELVRRFGCLPSNLVLCTDDLFPEDLAVRGHLDEVVRAGIRAGMTPVQAITAGSLNGALRHRLYNLGAIAPGRLADILLVPDLEAFVPDEVFVRGELVARGRAMLASIEPAISASGLENEPSVHLPRPLEAADFRVAARPGRTHERLKTLVVHSDLSRSVENLDFQVRDGYIELDPSEDVCWVAIHERHGNPANPHSQIPVKGLGVRRGGAASTVAHDCHNLLVIGRSPEDMAQAAMHLVAVNGGVCCACDGKIMASMPLPIGGLMSPLKLPEMVVQMRSLNTALRELGMAFRQPTIGLFSLALPVIPPYGVTDQGLVDVLGQQVISIWE